MSGEHTDSKRGRVRKMVIEPLEQAGFRYPVKTPDDKAKAELTRIIDSVSYMSDRGLRALRESLATKGEGGARHFWPCFATVIGLAEAFEKRPLEELPELLRWFRSAAGQKALEGDRLVAEYQFWKDKKRPPCNERECRAVADRAADYRRKVEVITDRTSRGLEPLFDDGAWLEWYTATLAYCQTLVTPLTGDAA